jgi:photosystem II stability/assembly factor-like uncharacterized protein
METTSARMAVGARAWRAVWGRWLATCLAISLVALLAACSGGGGGGSPAPTATITAQPVDLQVETGVAATFSVQATGSAQYQWQRRGAAAAANDWQDVPGATGPTYTVAAATPANNGDAYRVVVTWVGAAPRTSSIVTLTVRGGAVAAAITVQPADAVVVEGQDASFNVTASGTSLTYRWQTSHDGATWTDRTDSAGPTLQIAAPALTDDGTQLRVIVSNALGSTTSAMARLTVQHVPAAPQFSLVPHALSVVAGRPATFEAQAFGTPAPEIAWQSSADGNTWTTIVDATQGNYTIAAATVQDGALQYRAVASNSVGSVASSPVTLSVSPAPAAPVILAQPVDQTVAEDTYVSFGGSLVAHPAATIQWQVSTDGGTTFSNINGANDLLYVMPYAHAYQDGWRYRFVASNSEGSATSAAVALTVLARPTFTLEPVATYWRPGVVPAYFLAGTTGNGATLQWQTSTDGGSTWSDAAGATGNSFQLTSATDGNVNRVRVAATGAGGSRYSAAAVVTPSYWTPVTGTLTSTHLYGVRWTGATTAIAAGGLGTMLRSTDSGATWAVTAQLQSSTPRTLAVHGQSAIAIGYGWTVLRSVDAGAHWITAAMLNIAGTPYGLAFSDSAATAVGDGGVVERSTDGGVTWHTVSTGGLTDDLRSVAFNAAGIGVAVGNGGNVLRSVDGGATWVGIPIAQTFLQDVAFVGANTVVAVGYGGRVARSTDAGLTWQGISSGSTMDFTHVAFDGAGNGTATTTWQSDRLHTADGGQTWTLIHGPTMVEATDYAPVGSAAAAIAVGFGGNVETSADGGASWTSRTPGPHQVLRGITFGSALVGVAVGDGGTILRTVDGGDSWTAVVPPSQTTAMHDVAFASSQIAVAVGGSKTVWRSTDAGATWSVVYTGGGQEFSAIRFTSATHGVAVGSDAIAYTDDAGLTWHYASTPGSPMVQSVAFGSPLVGVAVGNGLPPGGWGVAGGAILRTTDGGVTWSTVAGLYSIDMTSVAFADANNVLLVGLNGAERSTDAGLTWNAPTTSGNWNAVAFTSATEGIFVSEGGYFGRTHDGGVSLPDWGYVVGDELCNLVVSPAGKLFVTTAGGAIYRNDAP